MNFFKKIFLSNKTTSILLLLLSLSMAIATFVEKKYSTDIAKIFIYESRWFEIIILLILINLIANIYKYKLWKNKKIPVLIFHLSFILIIIGGFISRYFSYEGIISLREGNTTNKVKSQKSYIKLEIKKKNYKKFLYDPYILSKYYNNYNKKFFFNKNPLKIRILRFISCPKIILSEKNPLEKIIKIIYIDKNSRKETFIKNGESIEINKIPFSFNKKISNGITILEKNGITYIKSSFIGKKINMINGKSYFIIKNKPEILENRCLYEVKINEYKKINWVIPEGIVNGELKYIESCDDNEENNNSINTIIAEVIFQKKRKIITFSGGKNFTKMSNPIFINNYKISIGYGSKLLNLPFYLHLNKFELKNYPGSDLPSSFMSYITIIDRNINHNHLIYMNNVLNYKGYRLFQSGYDFDKKGTHISVNNDYLGTFISYIGYAAMSIGMFINLFWKGTRFSFLIKKMYLLKNKKILPFLIIFFFIFFEKSYSNDEINHYKKDYYDIETLSDYINIPKNHSENFGKLLIQDSKGRIKPVNTMAIELLRKIFKKDNIGNLDANQWFISIHQDNVFWMKVPFIKIDKKIKNKILKKIRLKNYKKDHVSLINFYKIDPNTLKLKFLLKEDYKKSFSKNPIDRNEYDKSIINIAERIGIIHEIFQGKYIRIFPIINDYNNTWSSWIRPDNNKLYPLGLSMFNNYLKSIFISQNEKNWDIANEEINRIKLFQVKNSKIALPSTNKINAEIIYNKLNIFYYLSFLYMILGVILIINSFIKIFLQKNFLNILHSILLIILSILFIINSAGLITRWYISNHAPWTNGYESAIFISWCVLGVGFLFKKDKFLVGITSLISSILLMIAHGSAMDPEITNLVPVLKSFWLIIHVATIASSYGFFFTGSVLGFFVLIFFILKKFFPYKKNKISIQIERFTIINELCLTVGIFLLSIGTFLGSIWANNSWGRYWSWDPKETWAMISIMIYAFTLHIRLIPSMKNKIIFNFLSVLSISSIIMTYFGVNYYLSGLHSYAKGDAVSIPNWIYLSLIILFIVTIIAYFFEKKNKKNIF
ncbi:cytochrome c biogenesis protein [Blattabacterium cuenoti]|uniref:cytochrome c biogenesis protein n=1 Tax=Blattabacterium cuenoti TaxID=1653831 RepID=UPI00163CBBFD|nr:cytochrome c biogenesis protein CcsA [Blattabacterium cuenoti]